MALLVGPLPDPPQPNPPIAQGSGEIAPGVGETVRSEENRELEAVSHAN